MDKLKPLITHHFWILSGLALLIPLGGWWSATGALKTTIEERRSALDSAFSGIPSGQNPNNSWVEAVKVYNARAAKYNQQSRAFLWNFQKERMIWPNDIRDIMENLPDRAQVPNTARDLYRSSYWQEVRRVWEVIEPFRVESGKGLIDFPLQAMPQVDPQVWDVLPPTSKEMWDAQEDLWLLTALFESIARVNSGASLITESPVKSLVQIELLGGDRSKLGGGGGGGEGMDPAMGGDPAMMMADEMGGAGFGMGMGMGMPGRGAGMNDVKSVDFDPAKEFGDPGNKGGGFGGEDIGMMGADPAMMDPAGMGAGMAAPKEARRYVDDEEGMPFKTRAFYLKVQVNHRKVPDLLVELTNCDFPVEIVRVHQAEMYPDDVESGRGSMDLAGGAGDPGMGPMGAPMTRGRAAPTRSRPTASRGGDPAGFEPPMDFADPGLGGGNFGAASIEAEAQNLLSTALNDPDLVEVVIAGLMTIYRPVDSSGEIADSASEEESAPAAPPGDLTDTTPPAGDAAAAAGGKAAAATASEAGPATEAEAIPGEPGSPAATPEGKPATELPARSPTGSPESRTPPATTSPPGTNPADQSLPGQ